MKSIIYIGIFFIVIAFSCKRKNKITASPNYIIDTSKVFIKDIPLLTKGANTGDTFGEIKYLRDDVKNFNLDNLENGFDSLHIRVWLGHSMASKIHIVSIQRKESQWIGQLIIIDKEFLSETGEKLHDLSKKIKFIQPKSGWTEFIHKILALDIITLPDESMLSGYDGRGGGDGLPYLFEISTKYKYRFFSYINVKENLQFAEAKKVDKIATFLESEFKFEFVK